MKSQKPKISKLPRALTFTRVNSTDEYPDESLQSNMAGTKRKRSSGRSNRRSYKRSRSVSTSSVVRALAKANRPAGPFGPGTENFARYGPSRRQMLDNAGLTRTADQNMNRILDKYYGDGDYADVGRMIGGGLGAIGGGLAAGGASWGAATVPGAAFGGMVGSQIGEGIGHAADLYFGHGDYGRAVNQIVSGGRQPISVNQGSDRTGDIVISQTEYLGNISGTQSFTIESYELNPGLHKMFPFLSQIANNYELYEWEGLMVCYKPLSGEGGSDNVLGKVIICTNYDPTAANFRSSLEMQNYDYCSVGKPSQTIVHGVETAKRSKATNMMYVRNSAGTRDKVFTDIGKLFVATEGMPSGITGSIGELHVTYRVRLSRAKLFATLGNFGQHQTIRLKGWTGSNSPDTSLLVSSGDLLFKYKTGTSSQLELQLADANIVSGTFRITISGSSNASPVADGRCAYLVDSPTANASDQLIMHPVRTEANTKLTNWIDWNSQWVNKDTTVVGSCFYTTMHQTSGQASKNFSFMCYLSVDNPSDKQPSFVVEKGISADTLSNPSASTSISLEDLIIQIEQVDPLAKDAAYILGKS